MIKNVNYVSIPVVEDTPTLRNYVNTALSNLVAEINQRLQSNNFNGNRLTNVGAPVNQSDVATKEYVDLKPDYRGQKVNDTRLYEVVHFVLRNTITAGTDKVNHVPIMVGGPINAGCFVCKTAPSGGNAELDIQKSSDGGTTWVSLFTGVKIVVPSGDDTVQILDPAVIDSTNGFVTQGDKLRIDVTTANGMGDFAIKLFTRINSGKV